MTAIDLSILIATLSSRRAACDQLEAELEQQIANSGAAAEVILRRDDGEERIGAKRNRLVEAAGGRFASVPRGAGNSSRGHTTQP